MHPDATRRNLFFLHPYALLLLLCACVAAWSVVVWTRPPVGKVNDQSIALAASLSNTAEIDTALQRAATDALGERDGLIVVLDAQSGRVRAAVNLRAAEAGAFPPGSAIKPFTLLAALRSGVVRPDTRLLCRRRYRRAGEEAFTCAHPPQHAPLAPADALAHSCNFYFAKLGERLPPAAFNALLADYGFGAPLPTSVGDDQARTRFARAMATSAADDFVGRGRLPRTRWHVADALGEGGALLVTPLQLITAYAALANGGHLFTPQVVNDLQDFRSRARARLDLSDEERALLLSGMRGAIKFGTAAQSGLNGYDRLDVFGKTGTATEVGGFRTHGWFVGLAAERGTNDGAATVEPAPDASRFKLAVLVFLKRAQGKQCAALARPIFDTYARLYADAHDDSTHDRATTGSIATNHDDTTTMNGALPAHDTLTTNDARHANDHDTLVDEFAPSAVTARAARPLHLVASVRVRESRDGAARSMALDDYVFGVLAAEASTEDEFAALKAQAIVSRTYALGNLRRHERDGFDFCTSTHCQRFLRVNTDNRRPEFHRLLHRAINETSSELLSDGRARLAETYFHAACGGATADIETLWGTPAPAAYQRGVADDYCATMPYHSWTDTISAAQLAVALSREARTDVGARLDNINVIKRDGSGRAELVAVAGNRRRIVVRGWDFKLVVGRALGWNLLKSSHFEVTRAGDNFIFHGGGFGHGLGLCQFGAHVMAERGADYHQILAHYFPGTRVVRVSAPHLDGLWPSPATATTSTDSARVSQSHQSPVPEHTRTLRPDVSLRARRILSSQHFRISFQADADGQAQRGAEAALRTLEAARAELMRRLASASLGLPALSSLTIFAHATTGDFTAATGQFAWVAAITHGARIETQPLATLQRRGVLDTTLRHEYAHAVIDAIGHNRAPRWLAEGMAVYLAGEAGRIASFAPRQDLSIEELERQLAAPADAAAMRALYAAAHRRVLALIHEGGEASVWRRIARG